MQSFGGIICLLFLLALVSCGPASQASSAVISQDRDQTQSIHTATVTATKTATPTKVPTDTPTPPPTLTPTATDSPTSSATPIQAIPTLSPQQITEAGLELYQKQLCWRCHQLDIAGAQATLGPSHNRVIESALMRLQDPNYAGAATTPAEYLQESLIDPAAYLVPGYNKPSQKMPAFNYLDEAEIDILVQFLLQQQ